MSNTPTWHDVIGSEKTQAYFKDTLAYVANERQKGKIIYPPTARCV
ncbi:Uracil-DNA glycosylase [Providencia stuartii]|nr:Uracil-DNA glycosylase [Providencia stuartii]